MIKINPGTSVQRSSDSLLRRHVTGDKREAWVGGAAEAVESCVSTGAARNCGGLWQGATDERANGAPSQASAIRHGQEWHDRGQKRQAESEWMLSQVQRGWGLGRGERSADGWAETAEGRRLCWTQKRPGDLLHYYLKA